jgi:hypothetical protein
VRGEGECGRATESVVPQGSERFEKGCVARFMTISGSPLRVGLRPSFRRKASERLLGQPVSLKAGAGGDWRANQME